MHDQKLEPLAISILRLVFFTTPLRLVFHGWPWALLAMWSLVPALAACVALADGQTAAAAVLALVAAGGGAIWFFCLSQV